MTPGQPTCDPIDGVDPTFIPIMLRGAMACRYIRQTGIAYADAVAAAIATWDTEWPSDPEPRTFDHAIEAVDSDLEHWEAD